jgi:hypothetical protein
MVGKLKRWTLEDDERIRAFVAQGASLVRAAAALNVSRIRLQIALASSAVHFRHWPQRARSATNPLTMSGGDIEHGAR